MRYDGSRFVTLTTHDGLADNFVTSLWQDPASGALWASPRSGRPLGAASPQGQSFPARAGYASAAARTPGRLGTPNARHCPPRRLPAPLPPGAARRRGAHLPARRPRRPRLARHRRPGPVAARRPLPKSCGPRPTGPLGNELARIDPAPASHPGRRLLGSHCRWGVRLLPALGQPAQLVAGLPAKPGLGRNGAGLCARLGPMGGHGGRWRVPAAPPKLPPKPGAGHAQHFHYC